MTGFAVAPRPIGALLDTAIRVWIANLRGTLPLCLCYAALGVVPFVLLSVQQGHLTVSPRPTLSSVYWLLGMTSIVGFLRLGLYASACLWYSSRDQAQALSAREALLRGVRLLPRLLLVVLLIVGVLFVIAVPCVLISAVIAVGVPEAKLFLGPFVVCIWMVAFAYFGIRWAALLGAMVLEERGALASLERSWQLTKGQWWRCFAVMAIYWVLYLLVILLFAVAAKVIGATLGNEHSYQDYLRVFQMLLGPWIETYYMAGLYVLYLDLKVRKEGLDLAAQVERLSA